MDINMERFAEFMARMIEKYADEIDIETNYVVLNPPSLYYNEFTAWVNTRLN